MESSALKKLKKDEKLFQNKQAREQSRGDLKMTSKSAYAQELNANKGISIDEAYEICRKETAQWAKTFYLGTMLLPPAKRRAIWAIYVWCRRTDELMDSPEAMQRPVNELADRLDKWEEKTTAMFSGEIQDELDAVMSDTLNKFPQSITPYLDMIEWQ